ncbi:MAG: NAD(P)/FAD-dependent oxidoreductase [Gemmatimonadetes bacterium]|nr:NAD(P)/FAD-dependent oxidoreductase [Gemmatimonadota bacterium]
MKRILILGAGTAGTIMANRLHRLYRRNVKTADVTITVVDQDQQHVYQPGLLFVPFGIYRPEEIVKPRRNLLSKGVNYVSAVIDHVAAEENRVYLEGHEPLDYDVLVVATGSRVVPEETEGLTGPGWREKIFDFYTPEGAAALAPKLASFTGGRLVINIVEMPIKCPVAPLEFAFLADWYFTQRGIRDRVSITFVTPLDGAFTKPACTRALTHLLTEKRIDLVTEFNPGSVDGAAGELRSWDDRVVNFDLLVTIPPHMGAAFIPRSPGLGDEMGFVLTDPATLQSELKPNIFAIGDATNVPASKAGSVAHFEAEVLQENVRRYLAGEPLDPGFDGHANCFIETGHHKALLIDFNYQVEPLPGKFPFTVGPLSLLKESRLNHLGKLAFRWVYWHLLLPGRDLLGIPARMSMRGKRLTLNPAAAPQPERPPTTETVAR